MSSIPPLRVGTLLLALSVPLIAPAAARAATYYVAPTGSDTAAGTETAPFATVGRAQTAAAAGDTVLIRGGMYAFSGTTATTGVRFTKSGTAALPINYFAFPGEIPIFDLFNLTPQARITGLDVSANFLHIRGLEVRGVQQVITGDSWGIHVQGSNNVIENMNVHNNEAPGIFIASGANNLILNCDSHHNYDPLEGGGNADGFGCHTTGDGNVFSGCRSFNNSDDGFDFINAAGNCTVEKSFSFNNGYVPDTTTASGNGAGFKAGGYGSPPVVPAGGAAHHVVRQCVAFGNRSNGFYANHHPGEIDFFNNTAFRNGANFDMTADAGFPSTHMLRNNVALTPGGTIRALTGGTDTFNSWTLTVTVSAADFAGMTEADVLMPRAADGSLPGIAFMHLVAGSDLIDKGTDVGLPIVGAAADLGAFEFGATPNSGSGGAPGGGSGGSSGSPTGGASGSGGRAATGGASGNQGSGGRGGGPGPVPGSGGSAPTSSGGMTGGGLVGGGTGGAGPGSATGGSGAGPATGGSGISDATAGCACGIGGPPSLGGAASLAALLLAAFALRRRRRRQ